MLFCAIQSPDQQLQQGKFYFKDGSTYEGQYKVLGLAPPAADAVPAKKGLKKKEEEMLTQPAEPPKPVRHGVGEQLMTCKAVQPRSNMKMTAAFYQTILTVVLVMSVQLIPA